jgi:hypothetical protein
MYQNGRGIVSDVGCISRGTFCSGTFYLGGTENVQVTQTENVKRIKQEKFIRGTGVPEVQKYMRSCRKAWNNLKI